MPRYGVSIEQSKNGTCMNIKYYSLNRSLNKMENALVGKFMGSHPNISCLHEWVVVRWAIKGSVLVSVLPNGTFCFSLFPNEDFYLILYSSPKFSRKIQLLLYKWNPSFKPESHLSGAILTWVHF